MKLIKGSIFILVILLGACTNVKKVQVIQDALSKSDSSYSKKEVVIDSTLIINNIVEKIASHKLDFVTMNAKFKVDYESEKNADAYIANISITKDTAMYITIRGAMGVIGLKALIKRDSVTLVFPLSKKIDRRPLSYLQEVVKIPFTFKTLQDLIVGNPIFMDSTKVTSFKKTEEKLQVSLLGVLFKNLIILNEDNTKVLNLKLDDIDIDQHRTCDISYSQHTPVFQTQFPLNRDISIGGKSKLVIHMEVKEYNFNEPLKYTFAIPRPGKRR